MSKLVQAVEALYLKKDIPEFSPGDLVEVKVKMSDGTKERQQAFEGVVIAKRRSKSINASFTVRKISHGEGVERVFRTHSPMLESITVKRRGDVRRAKLYYLRRVKSKKDTRIKEKLEKSED